MYFLESRKHLKNQELDPSLVRDRQGFASRKHVAWVISIDRFINSFGSDFPGS